MRGAWVGAIIASVACAGAAAAAGGDGHLPTGVPRSGGATYRGSLTRIIRPRLGASVTGGRLGVRIRSRASLRSLDVRLNGRAITKRLRGSGGGVYSAVVAVGRGVHQGKDLLTVATNSGGHFDFDARSFVIARRAPGLVTIDRIATETAAAPVRVLGRLGRNVRLRVSVNGHDATSAFAFSSSGGRLDGRLDAGDGLRDGINRLVIAAVRSSSRRAEETTISRRFAISRTAVIAGLGADRRVLDGQFDRLSGTGSLLARGDTGRSFTWRIVSAPEGSRARLLHARSGRPIFVADLPGGYRIRETVTTNPPSSLRRRSVHPFAVRSSDTANIEVQPDDPYGVALKSNVSSGGQTGSIVLDGSALPNTGRANPVGISYAVIDRTTLKPRESGQLSLDSAGMNSLLAIAKRYSDGDSLMVFNWTGALASQRATLAAVFKQVGGGELPSADKFALPNAPGSIIGIPGAPAGVAFFDHRESTSFPDPGLMSGYLRQNGTTHLFDFVFTTYVPLDTLAPASTSTDSVITVGDDRYTYSHAADVSGFQVVTLDPKSLAVIHDRGYVTNSADGKPQPDITRLADDLSSSVDQPERPLVIMQSFGTPNASSVDWDRAARAIQSLGGTRQVFDDLNQPYAGGPGTDPTQGRKGGYAFVGRTGSTAPPAEVSYPLDGAPAHLKGLLVLTRMADYEPLLVGPARPDGAAPVNEALIQIANQAPTRFPDLDSDAPPDQVQAAENFLGGPDVMKVCPEGVTCNVRKTYYTNYRGSWQEIALALLNAKEGTEQNPGCQHLPKGVTVDPVVCERVRQQLYAEVQDANRVRHYLGPEGLQQAFGASSVAALANLGAITDTIQRAVKVPPASNTASDALELISHAIHIGALAVPEAHAVASGLGAAFGIAAYLTRPDNGPDLIGPEIQTTAAQLGLELTKRYQDAGDQLDGLGRIIVSDYGKLRDVAKVVDSNKNWILGQPGSSRDDLIRAAKQTISETLIPKVYPVLYDLGYPKDRQAQNWYCKYTVFFVGKTKHLFAEPDGGQVVMRFPNGWNPVMAVGGAHATGHVADARIPSPPADVIDPLFAPTALGGLGMKKLEFYSPRLFRLFPAEPIRPPNAVLNPYFTLAMLTPDTVPYCDNLPDPPGNSG